MNYIGTWVFHSIGTITEQDEFVYLTADEYLAAPMPYVDTEDEEAVADEMKERRNMIRTEILIQDDGLLYMLMPLPDGVTQEEVDAAVAAGEIRLHNGKITDKPLAWEMRDGELWYDTGMGFDDSDGWEKALDEDGYFRFATTRFKKLDA